MQTIADITLPGESFALGRLLTENPDMYVEIERLVPLGDRILPFFWVTDGSLEHIQGALESQPVVESVELLTSVGERHLYQVTWTTDVDGVVDALLETDAVILEGKGVAQQWEFRIRFPDHDSLKRFSEICLEKEIEMEVNGIYNPHPPSVEQRLTPLQWQTLATAYELGYFEIPRRTNLTELADRFEVSEQAISQRLRRALDGAVSGVMFDDAER